MKRFVSRWLPPVVWMTVIFLLSSRQRIEVSPEYVINFLFFKTLHVIEYAMLFTLYYRALRMGVKKKKKHIGAITFVLTLVYAISDELHQSLVPTREGKARDVIIDAIGASIAWYFLITLLPKIPKKLQRWAKSWQLL